MSLLLRIGRHFEARIQCLVVPEIESVNVCEEEQCKSIIVELVWSESVNICEEGH